jgi:hypothetical protein
VTLYRKYRSRALDLLEESLKQAPDPERREEILNDPAWRPLRLGPSRNPATRLRASHGPTEVLQDASPGMRTRRAL